jgi:Zn-dependent protease with chaperone function
MPAHEARLARLSRQYEFEADLHGVDLVARTWAFDPRGALLSLAFMQELARHTGRLTTPYDSHPPTSERYARVQQHLAARGYAAYLA